MRHGLAGTLRQLGSVFGIAVLGSILNSGYQSRFRDDLVGLPAQLQTAAEGSVAATVRRAAPPRSRRRLSFSTRPNAAYAGGMSDVILVCAGVIIAGAALVGLFLSARAEPQTRNAAASEDAGSTETAEAKTALEPVCCWIR